VLAFVVAKVTIAQHRNRRLCGRLARGESGGAEVVFSFLQHDDAVIAADQRCIAVGWNGEDFPGVRIGPSTSAYSRGARRMGSYPGGTVGGGAKRGANLDGRAALLTARADEYQRAIGLPVP